MYKNFKNIFIFLSFFVSSFTWTAEKNHGTGTLVVSYQTGLKGERLNRIRFTLANNKGQLKIYPIKNEFVDDVSGQMRVVIVDNLTAGKYLLEFIVPNYDGLFEEVPPRQIEIHQGETVKIDQSISIRYAKLQATHQLETPSDKQSPPILVLKNDKDKVIIKSESGMIEENHLLPGKYTLTFGPLAGYIIPDPITFEISPNQSIGPLIGFYKIEKGKS